MLKYILGFFKFLLYSKVSKLAFVDNHSQIDPRSTIGRKAKFLCSKIGRYSYVGGGSSIVHCDIGAFCSIAGNSIVGLANHTLNHLSTSPIFTEKNNGTHYQWCNSSSVNPYSHIVIGNDVWIGSKVIIMGGVTIGDGAVVGAGSIVTKDVPPYAIVAGVPAKIIRYRFDPSVINKLIELKWWNYDESILQNNLHLFQSENIDVDMLYELQNIKINK